MPVAIQCTFTFLFGLYAYGVYERTRSVTTCWAIHAICNVVGFPDLEAVARLPLRQWATAAVLGGLGLFLLWLPN